MSVLEATQHHAPHDHSHHAGHDHAHGHSGVSPVNDRSIMVGVSMGLLTVAALALWVRAANPSGSELALRANTRMFMCADTGRTFPHLTKDGEDEPVESPYSGRRTGWMAEACYWTRDGRAKSSPTWMIVKERMGLTGRTICPDCGREVIMHNPRPPSEPDSGMATAP